MHTSRPARLILACLLAASVANAAPAHAQSNSSCYDPNEETPEKYGPTDINAATGNGGLSVGLNDDATVTVFKWPSPSFYDQIKYRTTDRAEPRFGALPNEGAFLGLAWRGARGGWDFEWLRGWNTSQRFADEDTDEVVTTYRKRGAGLTVKSRDVVSSDVDVLVRHVTVTRSRGSDVRTTRLFSFANFNPEITKDPQEPDEDWCTENDNDAGAVYIENRDAIVHERSGTDASTGEESKVALAMGFFGPSDGFQVGVDTAATGGEGLSAYDDAEDGVLSGNTEAPGQADAAISQKLSLRGRRTASTTIGLAAAPDRKIVLEYLGEARLQGASRVRNRKAQWWREWLRSADLPRNAPAAVTKLAKRSLITLGQVSDRAFPLVMASIATQSPYGLDWIRDGSYINRALNEAGHPEIVAEHNRRYGELQATAANPPPGQPATPAGTWAQNYYADGVVGGPIPYEIDETGLGIWTLWDHYLSTTDKDYLVQARIYEAIQRAAHYLSDPYPIGCTDPTSNLHCPAPEGDNETASQTLVGAQAVWLGLDSAARAARVRGGDTALANAEKWETRRDEIGQAIQDSFFSDDCGCYTEDYQVGGALLWPVGFLDHDGGAADRQAEVNYRHMSGVFSGEVTQGRYESKMLVGNAYAWAGTPDQAKTRRGLVWVATVPTTDGTGLLGEAWMRYPDEKGPVTTMVSQPHATSHAMFYLAALKAYGRTRYSFD